MVLTLSACVVDRPFYVHLSCLFLQFPLTVSQAPPPPKNRSSQLLSHLLDLSNGRDRLRPTPSNKLVTKPTSGGTPHSHSPGPLLSLTPPSRPDPPPLSSLLCAAPTQRLALCGPAQLLSGRPRNFEASTTRRGPPTPKHRLRLPANGRIDNSCTSSAAEYLRHPSPRPIEPRSHSQSFDDDHGLQSPRPAQGGTQRQRRPARSSDGHPPRAHNTARTVAYGKARTLYSLPIPLSAVGKTVP